MSDQILKLKDFVRIRPDKTVSELDDASKGRILDAATTPGSGGLMITFDLSHSGRRINNRIYPPAGQREGADSWTSPYPKPILTNHDAKSDPIGRFVSVEWQSTEDEAINYLGSINDYVALKRAYDSGKPSAVYDQMKRLGLLDKKDWPGLGKLVAKAKITDKSAIEKFLDGRYLTFSAGSRTNAMTCMVCDSAWHDGDICDHRPGMKDEDGNVGLFMTGLFAGEEGSVVNMPADNLGFVESMEFVDFSEEFRGKLDSAGTDNLRWMLNDADENAIETDSILSVSVAKNSSAELALEDLQVLEPETVVKQIFDGKLTLSDALNGATHLETMWLIRIHDALHHEYDYRIQFGDEADSRSMPKDVYKLHGELHKISKQKGFRDSFLNGPLDGFDMKGSPSTEYMVKPPPGKDSVSEEINQLKDVIMELVTELKSEDKKEITEEVTDSSSETIEEATAKGNEDGTAHVEERGDENLEAQDKQEEEVQEDSKEEEVLTDSEVVDVEAALRERVLAIEDEELRAKTMEALGLKDDSSECQCENCRCKQYDALNADYVEALQTIDKLKGQLENTLDAHAKMHKADISDAEDTNRLDSLLAWFGTMKEAKDTETETKTKGLSVEDIKAVDNPGITSSEHQAVSKSLGDFEQRFISNYRKLQDEQGQAAADLFLRTNRKFLPRSFDLSEHIN